MKPPALRRVLLEMCGSVRVPDVADLAPRDWTALAALARLHRLGPQLFVAHGEALWLPPDLVTEWREAHRVAKLAILAREADLAECLALLSGHGFHPLVLKGAFLACHAWPDPAERPMRDIDLLVPADEVLPAYQVLRSAGYAMLTESTVALEDHARLELHMPPLAMPRGSELELHARLSELDGKLEYRTPAGDETGVLARAIEIDGLRYPCPTDMLAHLVIHAVYGHRFDCGPVVLGDLRWLVARHPIDWPEFWQAATIGGWSEGAGLIFALVRRYHGADAIPRDSREPPPPELTIVELATDLLLQDYATKKPARLLATLRSGGVGWLRRRFSGEVAGAGPATVTIDRDRQGGKLRWALGQFAAHARDLARPEVREQARHLAKFRRWIER
jgi:hypothetical protein